MRILCAFCVLLASCAGGDDIDELFEPSCGDSIAYTVRVRLWVDGAIVDEFRPGLRLRVETEGDGLEPTQTDDPVALENGYLISFELFGARDYQELEFFVDSQFAAEVIAGGATSAASHCNDEDDPGADQIPSLQIVHHDVVLDQF